MISKCYPGFSLLINYDPLSYTLSPSNCISRCSCHYVRSYLRVSLAMSKFVVSLWQLQPAKVGKRGCVRGAGNSLARALSPAEWVRSVRRQCRWWWRAGSRWRWSPDLALATMMTLLLNNWRRLAGIATVTAVRGLAGAEAVVAASRSWPSRVKTSMSLTFGDVPLRRCCCCLLECCCGCYCCCSCCYCYRLSGYV